MIQAWQARLETWMSSPWSGAALLGLTALCYLGALGAGFVWDDTGLVLRNELTVSWSNLPAVFAGDLWDGAPVEKGTSGYYRPLMVLSLMVDYQLFGFNALAHHVHSLLWHLLAVFLLLQLLRSTLGEAWAWPAAAVFALHGVQSEAVIWISARNDSMALSLGLVALILSLREERRLRDAILAGVFTALAGMTKESVLLLPVCMWMLVQMGSLERGFKRYLPMLMGIVVVLVIRAGLGVGLSEGGSALGWSLMMSKTHQLVGLIGQLVWVPWPLCAGYPLEWMDRLPVWRSWTGLALLGSWLVICLKTEGERGRLARWGLVWMGVCLVPVLPALAARGLFGERYLYLPLIGFGISLAAVLHKRSVLLLPLLLSWIVCVQVRSPDWRDDIELWSAAAEVYPSPYSHGGLGNALRTDDQPNKALSHFILAIDDPVPNLEICPQLVGTALVLGDPWGAMQLGEVAEKEKGCGLGPRAGSFHANLALAAAWTGQFDAAMDRLAKGLELGNPKTNLCSEVVFRLKLTKEYGRLAHDYSDIAETGCLEQADAALTEAIAGEAAGDIAVAMVLEHRWEQALELLAATPADPTGQDQVIRGAWALKQDDRPGYDVIRAERADPELYDSVVKRLLEDASI
jgi:hypothetical protein